MNLLKFILVCIGVREGEEKIRREILQVIKMD
jgi:hypothetical protein